jgi:hypothetical protein
MQVAVYGRKEFKEGDIYIGGFFDYNFKPNKIVTEVQTGKRIADGLYFIVEGRYNGFLPEEKIGVGIGLEYQFK